MKFKDMLEAKPKKQINQIIALLISVNSGTENMIEEFDDIDSTDEKALAQFANIEKNFMKLKKLIG